MRVTITLLVLLGFLVTQAQTSRSAGRDSLLNGSDTTVTLGRKVITLSEVVVRNNVNVSAFIQQLQEDTTFFKAFRTLRILEYTSLNDVQMMNRKGKLRASLRSKTRQHAWDGCRSTEVLQEDVKGDWYTPGGEYNYYTAAMYASLFFAQDTVCGENNVVATEQFKVNELKGMEKHREQLKMLFFNPGSRIPGIPLIGNKIAIFDPEMAPLYDYKISLEEYQGSNCYKFEIRTRENLSAGQRNRIVIDEMVTWFDMKSMEVMGRTYHLSYNAGVYDFDVDMQIEMTRYKNLVVPRLIRYYGNWDMAFKKRERGVFTATLFDFAE